MLVATAVPDRMALVDAPIVKQQAADAHDGGLGWRPIGKQQAADAHDAGLGCAGCPRRRPNRETAGR